MKSLNQYFPLADVLKTEFAGYSKRALQADVLAGITVAAVALPLALAFGIASGSTAAAGLVTAIIAGLVIGGLGGAGFQMSGPTGAMSAVLIVVAARYGIQGIWIAGVMAGVMILLLGIFDLGQIVNFIPSAVIAGFTSGIAVVIFVGQVDNLLGVKTAAEDSSLIKLFNYFKFNYTPALSALGISLAVIVIMALWPRFKKLNARFPGSLVALVIVTAIALIFNINTPTIGDIPRTIILDQRLMLGNIPWNHLGDLIAPAMSIAALASIESLLCGTAAAKMTGLKMFSNQELIAQGLGNIVIPFFGGVPATAAIARSTVAIKSGGRTRVVSIVHSVVLLLAAFFFSPILSRIPLAALAGVLAVTAWRMNDWEEIHQIFGRRFKSAMFAFASTMIATVALDLTQAVIIGVGVSALIFVFQISRARITCYPAPAEKLKEKGYDLKSDPKSILVVYVAGPLFFGSANAFNAAVQNLNGVRYVVLRFRTVSLLDTTGVGAIEDLFHRVEDAGGHVYFSGLNEPVRAYLERAGLLKHGSDDHVFETSDEAIIAADRNTTAPAAIMLPHAA